MAHAFNSFNLAWLPEMYNRHLHPVPQKRTVTSQRYAFNDTITVATCGIDDFESTLHWSWLQDDLERFTGLPVKTVDAGGDITLTLREGPRSMDDEGYALRAGGDGVDLIAETMQGLFYGCQTLAQLVWLEREKPAVQHTEIVDYPAHRSRGIMVDMGRAVFPMDLLKRVVRICARLKINNLHLHLNENEINPVRYRDLPLGSENPHAHSIADLGKLIEYANAHFVSVMPEVESWGHAGSLLHHVPELYGASRPHGYGHAFGVGPQTFAFLEKVYDEWMDVIPSGSTFHVGGDEANWYFFPGIDREKYSRNTLAERLHDTVQASAKNAGKEVTMGLWGGGVKHADMYVPQHVRNRIIMFPWAYRNAAGVQEQLMRHWIRDIKRYDAEGNLQSPFICGAGTVGTHDFGCILATQAFAERSLRDEFANCLGVNVMNWATNDVNGRLLPYYHGAGASWNPLKSGEQLHDDPQSLNDSVEDRIGLVAAHMRTWQAGFPDADPEAINRDRGPETLMGRWRWGEKHCEEIVPIWFPDETRRGDQDK